MPAPTCAEQLQKLHDAIMALATGSRAVTVAFGERSVTYNQIDLALLRQTYGLFFAECGAASGLPNLNAAKAIGRGGPMTFRGL